MIISPRVRPGWQATRTEIMMMMLRWTRSICWALNLGMREFHMNMQFKSLIIDKLANPTCPISLKKQIPKSLSLVKIIWIKVASLSRWLRKISKSALNSLIWCRKKKQRRRFQICVRIKSGLGFKHLLNLSESIHYYKGEIGLPSLRFGTRT